MQRFLLIISAFITGLTSCTGQSGRAQQERDFPVQKTEAEWRAELGDKAYYVLREEGTERAFTGKYNDFKKEGVFTCAGCGTPLFSSETKFDSGTGWPSFYDIVSDENVLEEEDRSFGGVRTEVVCGQCGGHLGHVFNDGPRPTGLRYCINSVSLNFEEKE
ncbi:MAG: peptide-methionine (R)-S-oxide reductase MsrB [Flavobacteriales bacterium]|nr:peptide-methionine (R)-S-oxide reductase MsrB [Flavobacteriales bacterium]